MIFDNQQIPASEVRLKRKVYHRFLKNNLFPPLAKASAEHLLTAPAEAI
jgi:hypothetical protein